MTLLFLISFLAVGGQTKKIIFLVGLGFTLGVFGTYLAIGVGLLQTADALGWPSWLGDSLEVRYECRALALCLPQPPGLLEA
jgi:hypothetical protein